MRNMNLTSRELEVLLQVAHGYDNPKIGEILHMSTCTAKAHVCSILQKLFVDSRTAAAIKGLKLGIINLDDIEI